MEHPSFPILNAAIPGTIPFSIITKCHLIGRLCSSITKSASASSHLGQRWIIETYLKGCTAELHGCVDSSDVSPHKMVSPIDSPITKPNSKPTSPYGCEFTSKDSLEAAANRWIWTISEAIEECGQIEHCNARKITSMGYLFNDNA